jgi:hypothetical protein
MSATVANNHSDGGKLYICHELYRIATNNKTDIHCCYSSLAGLKRSSDETDDDHFKGKREKK